MPVPIITTQIYRNQKITLFAQPMFNNLQAPLVAPPVWTVDLPLLVTLRPSVDGLRCEVVASGILGTVNVTVTALGQTTLQQTVQINILTDFADTLGVTAGNPIPQ